MLFHRSIGLLCVLITSLLYRASKEVTRLMSLPLAADAVFLIPLFKYGHLYPSPHTAPQDRGVLVHNRLRFLHECAGVVIAHKLFSVHTAHYNLVCSCAQDSIRCSIDHKFAIFVVHSAVVRNTIKVVCLVDDVGYSSTT